MVVKMLNLNKPEPVQEEIKVSPYVKLARLELKSFTDKEEKEEEIVPDINIDQDIARVSTYEDKELGLEAFYFSTEASGEIIYTVTTNEGKPYLAKYLNGVPFGYPTYYKDDNIEWWKEYNEDGQEIYYKDSNGEELSAGDGGVIDQTTEIPIGEDWNVDKNELYFLADQIGESLQRMDEILRYYIETNGTTVSQILDANVALNSINTMLEATNEYYTEPSED